MAGRGRRALSYRLTVMVSAESRIVVGMLVGLHCSYQFNLRLIVNALLSYAAELGGRSVKTRSDARVLVTKRGDVAGLPRRERLRYGWRAGESVRCAPLLFAGVVTNAALAPRSNRAVSKS